MMPMKMRSKVGWIRLLQIKPSLEAIVEKGNLSVMATEQHAYVRKLAGVFLQAFKSTRAGAAPSAACDDRD